MQDLKELNEVIAGIKDEICKGAETLTTSRSVYEFKKNLLRQQAGPHRSSDERDAQCAKRPEG